MTGPPSDPEDQNEVPADSWSDTQVDSSSGVEVKTGVHIPGYDLRGKIHEGGQGVVFRALQKSTNRDVAIKVLREGPYASEVARKRFRREVEIVARLEHPNIVSIFDSGQTREGFPFYVMEHVYGQELDAYLREERPSKEGFLCLMLEVLDAVGHAHHEGVIHRDLKSPNVLVDARGKPKVLDFGLAREELTPAESVVSVTGQFLGTVATMSPEQVRGDHEAVGPASDIYSLGILLYRGLTGVFPYPVKGSLVEVLAHITDTLPLSPSQAWDREHGIPSDSVHGLRRQERSPIDGDLETLTLKAISKEPHRRYESTSAFADDIRRYLEGQPILAKRDSGLYVLGKRLRRNRGRLNAAILALALVVVALYAFVAREPGRPPLDPEFLAQFNQAETEYLEVRGQLMGDLESRESAGESPMNEVTEESLQIVQGAVRELQSAIESNPQNPDLRRLLLATYQKELSLLRKICSLPKST